LGYLSCGPKRKIPKFLIPTDAQHCNLMGH
jgi:hypothetical protein